MVYVRNKILTGRTIKTNVGCGTLYVTLNRDENGKLNEIFMILGRSGTCSRAENEAIARCISVGLQNGTPVEAFIKTLRGIRCDKVVANSDHISSCGDAIAKVLEAEIKVNV